MVVRALERRAVVVHEVEVQVLEDDPAVGPDDAAVVHVSRVGLTRPRVLDLRRRGRPAGNRPAQQERGRERGVDQAREQPDAGQAARSAEDRSIGSSAPARELEWGHRSLDEPQIERLPRRGDGRGQAVGRQATDRHEDLPIPLGRTQQKVALRQVAVDVRREEQLAVVVTDHGLVRAQEILIGTQALSFGEDHAPSRRESGARNTSLTARWFR